MIKENLKQLLNKLKENLEVNDITISQEEFDSMIDYITVNEKEYSNPHELIWRLCGSCENINYNKVIDIFVDNKDSYYTAELATYISENLDQEYLVNKMLETNDIKFIGETLEKNGNGLMRSLNKETYKKLEEFYNGGKINK